jgi:hypothetical protein
VLLVIGGALYLNREREAPRAGSTVVSSGRVDIGARTPRVYRVVYRSESGRGDNLVVNTEEVVARRPFEARSVTRAADGRGARSTTVNAFARLQTDQTVLATGPGPAAIDRRAAAFLPEAVKDGYAESRERRRVAKRTCRIYRLAGSSIAASLEKVAAVKEDYSEVCVDEAGLILEEISVVDGERLTRRVAQMVDEDPDIDDDTFEVDDPTLGVSQGGGSVRRMAKDSRAPEEEFWEPDDDPKGFEHEGRYSVVPPQTGFDDPTQRNRLIAFTSDVWVDGSDVIVVEQGGTLGGTEPFAEDPNAEELDMGDVGEGQLVYGYLNTEVRVLLGRGRFVRVFGSVEPSRLLAVARSLEEKPGGKLVFEDELPSTPD